MQLVSTLVYSLIHSAVCRNGPGTLPTKMYLLLLLQIPAVMCRTQQYIPQNKICQDPPATNRFHIMDYIEQMTVDPDLKQRVGSLVGVVVYMLGLDPDPKPSVRT